MKAFPLHHFYNLREADHGQSLYSSFVREKNNRRLSLLQISFSTATK
jgi:hypothetical protein